MRGGLPLIVILIVLVGGWFLLSKDDAQAPAPEVSVTNGMPVLGSTTPEMVVENQPAEITIKYTAQGFSPKSVTVSSGTKVTFVNETANRMWVGADKHPTHEEYDGTSKNAHCAAGYAGPAPFDQCAAGTSYSFTFTKAGTWGYHNHSLATHTGTVVVTQ